MVDKRNLLRLNATFRFFVNKKPQWIQRVFLRWPCNSKTFFPAKCLSQIWVWREANTRALSELILKEHSRERRKEKERKKNNLRKIVRGKITVIATTSAKRKTYCRRHLHVFVSKSNKRLITCQYYTMKYVLFVAKEEPLCLLKKQDHPCNDARK